MNDAVFDGSPGKDNPIEWDVNFVGQTAAQKLTLQNGYTAQMTIDAGVDVLFSTGIVQDDASILTINFKATTSWMQMDGGNMILKGFDFTGQNGRFIFDDGAEADISGNFNQSTTATIHIYATMGATDVNLSVVNPANSRDFLNGAGIVNHTGATLEMDGTTTKADEFGDNNNQGGILENWGTVVYRGATGKSNSLLMPVLNHGLFLVQGDGTGGNQGGRLIIENTDPRTGNANFDMDNSGAELAFSAGALLRCQDTYLQSNGLLHTTDGLASSLETGPLLQGDATISGGKVKMGTDTAFGELDFWCGTLHFKGEYDPKVDVSQNTTCDLLNVKGKFDNQNGSTIVVTELNNLANNHSCDVLKSTAGTIADFTNKTLGDTSLLLGPQVYRLSW